MRRWLILLVALCAVLLAAGAALSAGLEIEGTIVDWKEVKARVPATAYLQLVKYGTEMKGTTNEEGYSAFDSKLPKIKVRDNGYFKLSAKELSAGKYFIALQRALPKEMSGESIGTAIPVLVTEKGTVLVVEVPGNYPMNVGKLFVAVKTKKEPAKKESVHEQPAPPEPAATESPKPETPKRTPGPEGIEGFPA